MTMGLDDVFEGPAPAPESPDRDPRRVLLANEAQCAALAQALRAVADRHELGDYGRFRLAVHAVDSLPIELGGPQLTLAGALHHGGWSPDSRLLAVAALLRSLGYGAVPQRRPDGRLVLALPVGDPPEALNVNLVKATARLRRGKGAPETIRLRWVLWDGEQRLGEPRQGGELVLPLPELVQGPSAPLHFRQRVIPTFTTRRPDPQAWPVHGHDDLVLTWNQHRDALDWLALMPALSFAHQVHHTLQELQATDLAPSLEPLIARMPDDRTLVDTLLRTVQAHITYQEGPLRDLFQILHDRTGDCDQLSLVMASLLCACGWTLADLRAFRWPGHLALGVRPRDDSTPEGIHVQLGGQPFYALDAACIHRTGQSLTSQWGQLNDRYARLGFKAERLG